MKRGTPLQVARAARAASGRELVYVPRQSSQVTAFLRVSNTTDRDAQKLSDQRQCTDQTRTRDYLTDQAAKCRKYSIETGFDDKTQTYRAAPLEPWTGPKGSQRLYQRVMFTAPVQVGEYSANELKSVEWLREEGLAGVDDDGFVRPLSDSRPAGRRAYPGAPVSDGKAKIGRTLRERGTGLVLAAVANLMRHLPVSKIGRRKLALADRKNGMSLSAYDVTTEANAVKAKRADLAEYRYLSVSTVRAVLKQLLAGGVLTEAEPPKALRARRTWRTLPRVFALIDDAAALPDQSLEIAA